MFRFAYANMNTADCASANCAEATFACTSNISIIMDAITMASILLISLVNLRHIVIAVGGLIGTGTQFESVAVHRKYTIQQGDFAKFGEIAFFV